MITLTAPAPQVNVAANNGEKSVNLFELGCLFVIRALQKVRAGTATSRRTFTCRHGRSKARLRHRSKTVGTRQRERGDARIYGVLVGDVGHGGPTLQRRTCALFARMCGVLAGDVRHRGRTLQDVRYKARTLRDGRHPGALGAATAGRIRSSGGGRGGGRRGRVRARRRMIRRGRSPGGPVPPRGRTDLAGPGSH